MTETSNHQEMISVIPKDKIELIDNCFVGKAFFLKENDNGNLVIHQEDFHTIKEETLPDFFYNKPIVNPNKDPFDKANINIIRENSPRSGYFLIKVVDDVRRAPNHLHELDNGIICAVNKDDKWETRYFPKQSLDSSFWDLVTK
jgi:hypothetical protein